MKAVYITEHGGTKVLTYGDLPEPAISPNDVKIRVRACALNRLDVYTRAGVRGTRIRFDGPHVLGGDVAGDVAEIGSEVTRVKPGDRVVVNPRMTCGQCRFCISGESALCVRPGMLGSTINGGYAEYARAPAVNAVPLPDSISYEQAASMPTVFLPCWSILMRRASLKPWETLLIPSASSGVGTAGIQVARNVIGARVIATTSTEEKVRKARELGADEVINYHQEDVAERVKELTGGRGVDVITGPRWDGLLAGSHGFAGSGRTSRHMRCFLRLQGGVADGTDVPEAPDRVWSLHGTQRRPATNHRNGRQRGHQGHNPSDLSTGGYRKGPRDNGGPQFLRQAGADGSLTE